MSGLNLILTILQKRIFELNEKNFTTSYIQKLLNLEDRHITAYIRHTLEDKIWKPGTSFGGHTEYLCDAD